MIVFVFLGVGSLLVLTNRTLLAFVDFCNKVGVTLAFPDEEFTEDEMLTKECITNK